MRIENEKFSYVYSYLLEYIPYLPTNYRILRPETHFGLEYCAVRPMSTKYIIIPAFQAPFNIHVLVDTYGSGE